MYKIVSKKFLNTSVFQMEIKAPLVARSAKAGEFIILRASEDGERVPFTIASTNKKSGIVKIIVQIVGATTKILSQKNVGDYIFDFVGPLGNPTEIKNIKNACIIGGGVGCAIAMPIAKALKDNGAFVTSIIGFRNKGLVILENEFKKISNKLIITTDDGSYKNKGNVTIPLRELLQNGEKFDHIFAIGPLVMMKYVTLTAKEFGVPVTVSMNPIMIDGTGMCGGCRLSITRNGKKYTKFACVDGPDFDGYEVDFDEMISRNKMYENFERKAYDKTCNLFKQVDN